MKNTLIPLWIATGNTAKAKELLDLSNNFFSQFHPAISREPKGVIEDEPTFLGNAKIKAHALVRELIAEGYSCFAVLADDSGLCVDILNGSPGVYSGRYSGFGSNSQKNVEKLLSELSKVAPDLTKRRASYHCALYFIEVLDGKISKEFSAEGIREGLIGTEPKGAHGYAYDAVFLDTQTFLSYGEISYEEKQKDSHRSRAFKELQNLLKTSI